MTRLRDEVLRQAAETAPQIPRRMSAPTGWEPGVKYDPATAMPTEVTTEQIARQIGPGDETEFAALIAHLLPMVPAGHEVRLVEAKYDPAVWGRDEQVREINGAERKTPATTRPAWRYRFRIVESARTVASAAADLPGLVAVARANRKNRNPLLGTGRTRVVVISDMQVGKVASGGGTPELYERILDKLAQLEVLAKSEKCDDLVIVDPGDLIENDKQVGSQKATNDCPVPEQTRHARVLLTEIVGRLSAAHGSTRVLTVPSNHGQYRDSMGRGGVAGNPSADWGIDVHRAVAEAYQLAKRDDITWLIPETWRESLSIQVRGVILGVVHGHQFSPGQAGKWWAGQTHGDQPTAAASILVHGHYHNASIGQSGAIKGQPRWIIAADAMDGGSDWFQNISGEVSEPSITTFTISGDRWDNYRRIVSLCPAK